MKIKYLGTGAAERVPAIFCKCAICKNARKKGGREIRTQSQALIDDGQLLIDFPGDSYLHSIIEKVDFNDIDNLLITHWHSDHFYGEDLAYRMDGYSNGLTNQLKVYGSSFVKKFYDRAFDLEEEQDPDRIIYHTLSPYHVYQVGTYQVFPLPAMHGHLKADCLIYAIKDSQGKTILYAHDTGYPSAQVFDYLQEQKIHFDLVSLDCTTQMQKPLKIHMNLAQNVKFKEELITRNIADESTIFVANHFSHNGKTTYEALNEISKQYNIITAFDGLELSF